MPESYLPLPCPTFTTQNYAKRRHFYARRRHLSAISTLAGHLATLECAWRREITQNGRNATQAIRYLYAIYTPFIRLVDAKAVLMVTKSNHKQVPANPIQDEAMTLLVEKQGFMLDSPIGLRNCARWTVTNNCQSSPFPKRTAIRSPPAP